MARPEQIPTDLTLEIGEAVSPDKFITLARAFFGYVEEISALVVTEPTPVKWNVIVREGSGLIGLQPFAATPPEIIERIYAKVEFGIQQLDHGLLEESQLPESALKHLSRLSGASENQRDRLIPLRVWIRRKPVEVTPEIARVIEDDWRVGYRDFGTVEGRLATIKDNDGRLQLEVRDPLLRRNVKCNVPDEMLDDIFANFRKRVELTGTIHYRRNGTPVAIDVLRLDTLPDDSELPTAEDVRGLLRFNGDRTDILG